MDQCSSKGLPAPKKSTQQFYEVGSFKKVHFYTVNGPTQPLEMRNSSTNMGSRNNDRLQEELDALETESITSSSSSTLTDVENVAASTSDGDEYEVEDIVGHKKVSSINPLNAIAVYIYRHYFHPRASWQLTALASREYFG